MGQDYYPFGILETKYVIPSTQRTKRALSKDQLKVLTQAYTRNLHQEKARKLFVHVQYIRY